MENYVLRSALTHTKKAIAGKKLTIGFLGGSITQSRVPHNWGDPFIHLLTNAFRDLTVVSENVAIGATGSDLGFIRLERDILEKDCDLVFIEYAVNDMGTPTKDRMGAMEGIIRKLLTANGGCDVILVYTYCQDMYEDLMRGTEPPVIAEYEQLADHYRISSCWPGKYAFECLKNGMIRFEEWLPDGLHPQYRGSELYARCVWQLFGAALEKEGCIPALPHALNPAWSWENAVSIPVRSLAVTHPFYIKRCSTDAFVDYVACTSAVGAELDIDFTGTGCVLVFDFGRLSCEFEYSVDGGPVTRSDRDRPAWCGDRGWLRPYVIADDLPPAAHRLHMRIIHGNTPDHKGTNFELTNILVLR